MGASRRPFSEPRIPASTRRPLPSVAAAGRARRRRRGFLRRSDLALALVALAAVGYTIFALVQGAGQAPQGPGPARSAASASGSDPGARTAEPGRPGGAGPVAQGGVTGPDGGRAAGRPGATPARATPGTSHRTTPTARPDRSPAAGRGADGDGGTTAGATTAQSQAQTSTSATGTTQGPAVSAAGGPGQNGSPGDGGPGPATAGSLTPGSTISLRATTACCTTRYVRHQYDRAITSVITSSSSSLDKNDASWIVRVGLADASCVSFESKNYPGDYLRHSNFRLYRQRLDGTALFRADATFCPTAGKNGTGTSFASSNYPTKFLRQYDDALYLAGNGGSNPWDSPTSWADDVSWVVTAAWAS